SEHLGRERNDLHELHVAQLARHGPENTGADRLELVGQQHGCVAVEADQRSIRTTYTVRGAYHYRVVHLALLDLAAGNRVLDAHLDDITNSCIPALGATEYLDALQSARTAVVGRIQHCL